MNGPTDESVCWQCAWRAVHLFSELKMSKAHLIMRVCVNYNLLPWFDTRILKIDRRAQLCQDKLSVRKDDMLLNSHWCIQKKIHVNTICIHQSLFLLDYQCFRTLFHLRIYLLIHVDFCIQSEKLKKGLKRSTILRTVEKHWN